MKPVRLLCYMLLFAFLDLTVHNVQWHSYHFELMNRNIVTGSDGQWCVYTNVVLFFLILFFSETSESSWVKWARENKRRVQEIKIKNYFFFPPPLPLALVVNKSPAVYNIILSPALGGLWRETKNKGLCTVRWLPT